MTEDEHRMHIYACNTYGQQSACDGKIKYRSEKRAMKAAEKMTNKHSKLLEAYPCAFCNRWHIGRALTTTERYKLYKEANELHLALGDF